MILAKRCFWVRGSRDYVRSYESSGSSYGVDDEAERPVVMHYDLEDKSIKRESVSSDAIFACIFVHF